MSVTGGIRTMLRKLAIYRASLVAAIFVCCAPAVAEAGSTAAPCLSTQISKIVMPSGPARVESGRMRLATGAVLELSGPPKGPDMYRVSQMHVGDPVAACYGPPIIYADAGASRTFTVLDLRNGQYFGTLIGSWSR